MPVQFNHSYACQPVQGSSRVVHFHVVELNVEDIDEVPLYQNPAHDPLLGVEERDPMSDLLLRFESMQRESIDESKMHDTCKMERVVP